MAPLKVYTRGTIELTLSRVRQGSLDIDKGVVEALGRAMSTRSYGAVTAIGHGLKMLVLERYGELCYYFSGNPLLVSILTLSLETTNKLINACATEHEEALTSC